ncbi:7TM diverse intracellular signaling domain-containing protein [Oligoflexus tunisiensis]|uniref:7TM diverse intracellular signaling domain-containing protein n=1 Tax=Oligoflexus tunisiensis TaxID=708132 RepID=UPI000B2FE7A2|nr:7TM diverse intracellular signaling domain-containing protein [Oligoflexus tunisiensis]
MSAIWRWKALGHFSLITIPSCRVTILLLIKTDMNKNLSYFFGENWKEVAPIKKPTVQIAKCSSRWLLYGIFIASMMQPLDAFGSKIESVNIGPSIHYFEDLSGEKSIEQIARLGDVEWTANDSEALNLGWKKSIIWLKFTLDGQGFADNEGLLEIAYPLLDSISLYIPNPVGGFTVKYGGDRLPFHQREFDFVNFVFKVPTKDIGHPFYLRIQTESSVQVPLVLWSMQGFSEHNLHKRFIIGIYYGIILIMCIYNVFLYFFIRDFSYIVYTLYITAYLFFQSSLEGYSFQYLWPDYPKWAGKSIPLSISWVSLWFLMFTKNFLGINNRSFTALNRCCQFLAGMSLLLAIAGILLPYSVATRAAAVMIAPNALLAVITALSSLKGGKREAKFYLLAFGAFILGTTVTSFRSLGIMPTNMFTLHIMQIGSALEIILLSLALGDKIRQKQVDSNNKIDSLHKKLQKEHESVLQFNRNLEKLVSEKTAKVRTFLRNIKQGLLMINPDGSIDPEYSSHLSDLMGIDRVNHIDLVNVLLKNSNLSKDDRKIIESVLHASIGEEELCFELNAHALKKDFIYIKPNGEQLSLMADWNPVVNQDGIVEKILVALKDVTKENQLQRQSEARELLLSRIDALIDIPPHHLADFFNIFERFSAENKRLIQCNTIFDEDILKIVFINVHTLKGLARGFRFKELSELFHEEEHFYSKVRSDRSWPKVEMLNNIDKIEKIVGEYQFVNAEKLGRKDNGLEKTSISKDLFVDILHFFDELKKQPSSSQSQKLTILRRRCIGEIYYPLTELFHEFKNIMLTLAKDLGKPVPTLEVQASNLYINDAGKLGLKNVFTHIFRNSMDHGIETPELRRQKGKDPAGKMRITITKETRDYKIIFDDDGQGLDLARLKQIGLQINKLDKNHSDHEIAMLIFELGVSTSRRLSEVSGRGVGMLAIREYLENLGGKINIALDPEAAEGQDRVKFQLEMTLPEEYLTMP